MANVNHIGKNVGAIYNMPWEYHRDYPTQKKELQDFEGFLKSLKYKYLSAITADKFQRHLHKLLKKCGFKPQVTFYSSHNVQSETLTLWTKSQSKIKNVHCKNLIELPTGNCSVSFTDEQKRLNIKTNPEGITDAFKKVKNMPIWFKVLKENLATLGKPEPKKKKNALNMVDFFLPAI